MNKKKIIILGNGGHARSCIDVINHTNQFTIAGIVEKQINIKPNSDYPILGIDKDLKNLRKKYKFAFIAIGHIKTPRIRINKFLQLKKLLYVVPKIISPIAYISKQAMVGEGTIIHHNCVINSDVLIGKNNIINTNALIEHNVKIGNNNHISTGAIINGNVIIGNGNFIGSGTIIYNGIKIGNDCKIASGSIIKKDLPNKKFYK